MVASTVLLVALVLVGKLYLVQVVRGSTYAEKAERQYVSPAKHLFDRGSIYFQNKDGSSYGAATINSGFTLVVNPKKITSPETTYKQLQALLPTIDHDIFVARASKDDQYEEMVKRVDKETGSQISALKIPGVSLVRDQWRVYPGGDVAAQTVGFVGYNGDVLDGRYGLERFYQETLRRDSDKSYVNFFAEVFSDIGKVVDEKADLEGDLVTTIEPSVQMRLEQVLGEVQKKWSSDLSGGIIMDPKTGEIYAMGAVPTFDPNHFQKEKDLRVFSNPLVENVYEMGSIIKPITMAAGIDAGAVTADTTYVDTGSVTADAKTLYNSDKKHRGVTTMQEVLNKSLNTGASFVVQKMGKQAFKEYLLRFGFDEETGIDVPNESRGLLKTLIESPRDIESYTASFGQGIALSPIATIRALSALGNGGYLPNPHVVKEIDYKIGVTKKLSYPDGRQVLKPGTSEEISRMLVELVDKALRNGKVKLEHYSVAAKTGTAQISQGGTKGYYADRYLHSFFGYFPAYNPRFIVFLYTVYPKKVDYASETLTGPFFELTNFLLHYYEVPPDR